MKNKLIRLSCVIYCWTEGQLSLLKQEGEREKPRLLCLCHLSHHILLQTWGKAELRKTLWLFNAQLFLVGTILG